MLNALKALVFSLVLIVAMPASADSATGVLANCLIENLSGKERKSLATWIFLSMAAHPEIRSYSRASKSAITESDRHVGEIITRLLTVNCPSQLQKAHASDPMAVQKAFELVGQVAMQELMTNQDVMKALTNYVQYADVTKINKLLGGK